jgi:DegV family protein with EDD domain
MSFWIVSDSCTDFPEAYAQKQKNLTIVPLMYQIEGQFHTPDGSDEGTRAFYSKLRDGVVATTAQVTAEAWKEAFQEPLSAGHDVLCIAFSSALSGTYDAAVNAKEQLLAEFPNSKLTVIDSKCASMGQGLLVHQALQMRDSGASIEETAKWVTENQQRVIHWFTVDDLQFLRRGGRVSATSAYLGGIMKIKPILQVNEEGKLIPREKVQGRKRSLRALFDKVKEYAAEPEKQTIFLSHGDCLEEAEWLASILRDELHVKDVLISFIGPVIGSHSGPGTMAIFFMGNHR